MSWEQLLSILNTQRERQREFDASKPESCPIDGQLLDDNGKGVLNCPMGNFRWTGQPRIL